MRILICDDEEKYINELKVHIEEYLRTYSIKADFFTTAYPKDIIKSDFSFDLAFLDIQMPEIDGITLAKELKNRNSKVILFFVTAFEEYQDEAMDLHIFRFFEKPFDVKRLYSSLDKAMEFLDDTYIDIYLDKNNEQVRVPVDDIYYVKRENKRVTVFTSSGEYCTKRNFNELIEKLPNTFFYLVHKSFLINVHYVTKYGYKEVCVNETKISVATRKQADFHRYWFEYVKRR